MRKNFTQLFFGLALMLGFTTASNAQCDIPPPADAYFNFQFDGGNEGWRSLDAAGFENNDLWVWSETGSLKQGAFSTNYPDVIASESQCNGAMVMDSDFLDNAGLGADGFGTGLCPSEQGSECNGYLVSPVMDLSASNAIEILYTQSVRQFQSSYFIYVSIDGGMTNVDSIEINDDLVTNAAVSSESFRIPLCSAGGQSNVVITFHYVSNYYVWALDDISLVEAEEVIDMRVNRNFYSKVTNYMTPRNMTTTVPILADIENLKAFENPGSTLNFTARDAVNTELFTASREYGPVPGCSTDENKLFEAEYEMPNTPGAYTVEFEIDSPGDVNPENDIITAPFRISNEMYRKLPTPEEYGSDFLTGVRYGGSYVSWGAYFYMPNNDMDQTIDSITLGIVTNAGETPSAGIITVGVYQWIDFMDIGRVNAGERVLLGEATILVEPNSPESLQWTVTPLDSNGDKIAPVAGPDGVELLIMAHTNPFDGVTNYFFNCVGDVGFEEYSAGATSLAHRTIERPGGYGSFASLDSASDDDKHEDREFFNIDGVYVFDISMELSPLGVSTEDINEDLAIKVFPSLATDIVNVELNLEELSENVSIELMDFSGNLINVTKYSNIKSDNLSVDVSELTSGMYLLNVRTENGMTSRKISVIR